MSDRRSFHIGDVLSITTGRLLSLRHMEGVYDILNFMTGDNLFTHQLPRASDECRPYLLRQHPELKDVYVDDICRANVERRIAEIAAKHGTMLSVSPIPLMAHKRIDPISEAESMMGGKP